jgi:hypothetical protein
MRDKITLYLIRFIQAIEKAAVSESVKNECLTVMYYNLKKKEMLYIFFENVLFDKICPLINNWLLFELRDYQEFFYFHHKLTEFIDQYPFSSFINTYWITLLMLSKAKQ